MPAIELLPRVWCEKSMKYRRPWGGYRKEPPTLAEVRTWFRDSEGAYGMAILGGAVSGGLEIIDLDNWGVVEPWTRLVEEKAPGLLKQLVLVKTPRPGLHVYFRSEVAGGNQKLARAPETDPETGKVKPKTIIEVKGEGGYCLAPPSPATCHPSGRCYTFVGDKDLTRVPTITVAERQVLFDCSRTLNCWQHPRPQGSARRQTTAGQARFGRPGDDFNARGDWAEILEPYGWTWQGTDGAGADYWCRPGKGMGTSATANFCGSNLLFVFSSNAEPLEGWTGYTKFHAYALLAHGGDFAAAHALRSKGYGGGLGQRSRRSVKPFQRYAEYPVRLGASQHQ
jgi:hypothetical protein